MELSYAPSNLKHVKPADPVVLQLDIKNVPSLLVKVYEINTRTYYTINKFEVRRLKTSHRRCRRHISTDVLNHPVTRLLLSCPHVMPPPVSQLPMDIQLEGLGATMEHSFDFVQCPAMLRHRESIPLDGLQVYCHFSFGRCEWFTVRIAAYRQDCLCKLEFIRVGAAAGQAWHICH